MYVYNDVRLVLNLFEKNLQIKTQIHRSHWLRERNKRNKEKKEKYELCM